MEQLTADKENLQQMVEDFAEYEQRYKKAAEKNNKEHEKEVKEEQEKRKALQRQIALLKHQQAKTPHRMAPHQAVFNNLSAFQSTTLGDTGSQPATIHSDPTTKRTQAIAPATSRKLNLYASSPQVPLSAIVKTERTTTQKHEKMGPSQPSSSLPIPVTPIIYTSQPLSSSPPLNFAPSSSTPVPVKRGTRDASPV